MRYLVLFAALFAAAPIFAAPPAIRVVSPRGIQSGVKSTLVIEGSDLLPEPKLLTSTPLTRSAVKPGATDARIELEIELPAAAVAGLYPLRLANAKGISNAAIVSVESIPQIMFAPEIKSLPAALHGNLAGGEIRTAKFSGKAGDRLVIDVEAQRIGSQLRPVLRLLDANRRQVAWAAPDAALQGDSRIDTQLPADGDYTIEMNDALYNGPAPGEFRMRVGRLSYASLTMPMAIERGKPSDLTFVLSNIPADKHAQMNVSSPLSAVPALWPTLADPAIGPRPMLVVSDHPEIIEPATGQPLASAPPIGISGRLSAANEQDKLRIPVTPGTALRFDLLAQRAGSPLDGVLSIENEQGGVLASNDDRPGTSDPGLDFTVPAGTSAIVASIRDLHGRGGPAYVYRLSVTPANRPDFSISLADDRANVPAGGTTLLRVKTTRSNYAGPIKLAFEGLPGGITVAGDEIPAGETETLLSLISPANASGQAVVSVRGTTTDAAPVSRPVTASASSLARLYPWLAADLAVAIGPAPALKVDWSPSLAPGAPLHIGTTAALPVQWTSTAKGPVRLSIVTNQTPPVFNDGPNKGKPDVNRALRAEANAEFAQDAATGAINLILPGNLPKKPYDIAIVAELLSPDKKTVLASAVTPMRRIHVEEVLKVAVTGEAKIEGRIGPAGTTGQLKGTITRSPQTQGPVKIELTGLPANAMAPSVMIPAGKNDFAIELRFAANARTGPYQGVQLVASYIPDPAKPNVAIKSNTIPVNVVAVP